MTCAYFRDAYDRAYENFISPMPSQDLWVKTRNLTIKPLVYHKQAGRPKKSRMRWTYEIPKGATKLRSYNIVTHCRICAQQGHNATNCRQNDRERQTRNSQRPRQAGNRRGRRLREAVNRQDAPIEPVRTQTTASQTPYSRPMRMTKLRV